MILLPNIHKIRVMHAFCKIEDHYRKPYAWICTNPICENTRISCSKCLTLQHKNCLGFMLHIDDIYNPNFLSNSNWIHNKDIKEAIAILKKYNLGKSKEQFIRAFEDIVNQQFNEITKFFEEKLNEKKQGVIKLFKEAILEEKVNTVDFETEVNLIYNTSSFINILNSFQREEKELELFNRELSNFFNNITNMKSKLNELQTMAKSLTTFAKKYLEVDFSLFSEFKESIPFDMLNRYSPLKASWTWSPEQKSSKLSLNENNLKVRKLDAYQGYSGVLGNIKMAQGTYQWEISASTGNGEHNWISFGITAANPNIEKIDFNATCSMSTKGQVYYMNKVRELSNYDDKVYLCELDMEKRTFTVSYKGKVLCKQQGQLKEEAYYPFVILYQQGNCVSLKVIK